MNDSFIILSLKSVVCVCSRLCCSYSPGSMSVYVLKTEVEAPVGVVELSEEFLYSQLQLWLQYSSQVAVSRSQKIWHMKVNHWNRQRWSYTLRGGSHDDTVLRKYFSQPQQKHRMLLSWILFTAFFFGFMGVFDGMISFGLVLWIHVQQTPYVCMCYCNLFPTTKRWEVSKTNNSRKNKQTKTKQTYRNNTACVLMCHPPASWNLKKKQITSFWKICKILIEVLLFLEIVGGTSANTHSVNVV